MKIVEVTRVQKRAAQIRIRIAEEHGEPVRDWTRRVAAATRRPEVIDPELKASDEVVPYLV